MRNVFPWKNYARCLTLLEKQAFNLIWQSFPGFYAPMLPLSLPGPRLKQTVFIK
jgi:hypothetical protein